MHCFVTLVVKFDVILIYAVDIRRFILDLERPKRANDQCVKLKASQMT